LVGNKSSGKEPFVEMKAITADVPGFEMHLGEAMTSKGFAYEVLVLPLQSVINGEASGQKNHGLWAWVNNAKSMPDCGAKWSGEAFVHERKQQWARNVMRSCIITIRTAENAPPFDWFVHAV